MFSVTQAVFPYHSRAPLSSSRKHFPFTILLHQQAPWRPPWHRQNSKISLPGRNLRKDNAVYRLQIKAIFSYFSTASISVSTVAPSSGEAGKRERMEQFRNGTHSFHPHPLSNCSKWCNLLLSVISVRSPSTFRLILCVATAFFQSTFNHIELQLFYSIPDYALFFDDDDDNGSLFQSCYCLLPANLVVAMCMFCSSFNPKQLENKLYNKPLHTVVVGVDGSFSSGDTGGNMSDRLATTERYLCYTADFADTSSWDRCLPVVGGSV